MFFRFQNKAERLNCLEKWKSKGTCLLTDFWLSRFHSQGCENKLPDACDIG